MGWTKKQLVMSAFEELALASYEFDITPDEQQTMLRKLDAMLATWEHKGIQIGYAFPSSPDDSDIDDDSGIPDFAAETVYLNLAIRGAPGNGKQISADTKRSASEGYLALLSDAAVPRQQQFSGMLPIGAGNRYYPGCGPFYPPPDKNPLQVTYGGDLDIPEA